MASGGSRSTFEYKVHIGVDSGATMIRRVVVMDASVTGTEMADQLICGDEKAVYGDQAYSAHARMPGWLRLASRVG